MEDVTDTVFRRIVAACGRPAVFFSEFTSTDGMFSPGRDRVTHRLKFSPQERPLVAQIWGNNPENYLRAAENLREQGFDGIDINFGCPVDKIVKSGACSALIENRSLAAELIAAAKEGAGDLPISVKTRLGFSYRDTESWSQFLLEQDVEVITMHGRISKHLSKYPADWEEIGKVVELRNEIKKSTLIIGNGDVSSYEEAHEKAACWGVDGVMIGRGIFQNLFLFDPDAVPLVDRSTREKLDLLEKHIDLFEECWAEEKPFRILKKYFKIYAAHFPGAAELRMSLVESESYAECRSILDSFRAALRDAA